MIDQLFYIEGKHYSQIELLKNLSQDDISNLGLKGILEVSNNYLKFNFVGVISIGNIAFIVLPKTTRIGMNSLESTTIKTLKKYSNSNIQKYEGIDYFNTEPDHPECSELAIAEFLIRDFQENGIFIFQEQFFQEDGEGNINWALTISDIDPIYCQSKPLYVNTINQITIEDKYNLIIAIHKWALAYVTKKYSFFLCEDRISLHFDYQDNINDIGSIEMLINYLQRHLQIIYSDREIHLIKSLLFLLKNKAGLLENNLSLFGTKKYENVWESICKLVVKDISMPTSYFPNPKWNILGVNFISKSTLIPDITSLDPNTKKFYLFDAKYYNLKYDNQIYGEPGYKDILKQFQYQHHIEEEIGKAISNAFLFPLNDHDFNELGTSPNVVSYDEDIAVIGFVEYKLYSSKKIWIIMCPFSKWQHRYIQNKPLEYSKIFWSL